MIQNILKYKYLEFMITLKSYPTLCYYEFIIGKCKNDNCKFMHTLNDDKLYYFLFV
jgi:hypothetical protein